MDKAGWVINLASSPDRMAHADAELSRAGLETRRIEAYDGRGKDLADFEGYDDARTRRFMGRSMSAGELGCYLSHIRALNAFLESPAEVALILEDDFQWTEGGPEAATTAMDWLAENSHWHAVNVGASKRKITSPLGDLSGRELVRAHYFPMLAHAMIWSRAGAEALLAVATPIFCPADNMYRHVLTRSDKGLALYPPAASAGAFDSDITARSAGGSRSTQARSAFYGWRKQKRLWTEKLIATTHKARGKG